MKVTKRKTRREILIGKVAFFETIIELCKLHLECLQRELERENT